MSIDRCAVAIACLLLASLAIASLRPLATRNPHRASAATVEKFYDAGVAAIDAGDVREAQLQWHRALQLAPNHPDSNRRLGMLLQSLGRTWESSTYTQRSILAGQVSKTQMMMVSALDTTFIIDEQLVDRCIERNPSDPSVLLVRARQALVDNKTDEAEALLRRIVEHDPNAIEAQLQLGTLLFHHRDDSAFAKWRSAAPGDRFTHPEAWYLEGLWQRRHQRLDCAKRCFIESARLDPNHAGSIFQLSQLLQSDDLEMARQMATRAKRLSRLSYLLAELREMNDFEMIRKTVNLLAQLDRPLEAIGWCRTVRMMNPNVAWASDQPRELAIRCSNSANLEDQFTLPSGQLAKQMRRDLYRLPPDIGFDLPPRTRTGTVSRPADSREQQLADSNRSTDNSQPDKSRRRAIRFRDASSQCGIDFSYFNGTTADAGLVHILQATGGGIAVIDYDQDGWQDLYFVQSGPFPIEGEQTQYRNRMYRNLGDGHFHDVTDQCGLGDARYGQGVAVGDINSDGFPDVYVANFGPNSLYINQADGSFRRAPGESQVQGDHWTTSCMIVDLNNDALPEVYAVNYALKSEVLEMMCRHNGKPKTCAPTLLTAAQDQLYENRGDGNFQNVTDSCGLVAEDGKGLGVVAADFARRGQLDVFVANDTSANFYYFNNTGKDHKLAFREQAVLTGVGFDEIGKLQACMGVAAGDPNNDGRLDLFVTNFFAESNVLYLQNDSSMFNDATRDARLREPSMLKLGFGTQFIDADADGLQDLAITNGHIDRTIAHGNPDRMPPQFMYNVGDGSFVELPGAQLGPYFERAYFGRSLAVLDWNRDGRQDFCVSHLDAKTALLTNDSSPHGNFLDLQLRGVLSNRDALGASVELEIASQRQYRQLVGGDGYFISSQRHAYFGIGNATNVDRLRINWPSGQQQTFTNLPANREWLLVEGQQLTQFPSHR